MVRLSKSQRKAIAKALDDKWKGTVSTDSVRQVQLKPLRKHGTIYQVKR
jgi:hypothetical protein